MKENLDIWFVYVIYSEKRQRFYVGCCKDIIKRLLQHNGELKGGAKYTRSGRPWKVLKVYGPYDNRSEAQKIESKIKKRKGKERITYDI